ncbi:MAG: tetratricopeptide repeat protein [candidate division WOR-3 bacterium]|nr:tetratricopeptide repeat protein [candidate division WOR-3 bacterium]
MNDQLANLKPGNLKPSAKERVVRVFISSTFRDMFRERDILVKRIFPQLRKLCEERFVTWGEVDLRWGVPDEKKAEGKVLPICLEEIRRCRPYFIGVLGERYGSLPEELPQDLLNREPWLKEHLKHSLTELEIWHGVLNDLKMAGRSFFYFRDPGFLNRLPTEANRSDFASESPEAAEKLAKLKTRIRSSGLPVCENYADPEELGDLVLEDLTKVIDELYPPGSEPAPLDREAMLHDAFARSRARVYIGRDEYFRQLDEHASGDGPPLVILGNSGSGKSALLANWAQRFRKDHPDDLFVLHFIGASPYSSDWAAMLRRILGEFKRRYGFKDEIPDKPDALRAAFANWLHMAAAKGRVILILDALNQLEDRDGAPDLVWLPPVIPTNVRLVLSTLPGRPLDDLNKRNWPTLTIQPFTAAERARFIKDYLALYRKELSPASVSRIAAAKQTENPLFLQALLEELRLFGKHEALESRIALYLQARDIPSLYELILARYEEDYEDDRPGLVKDAMTAIWAARRGLTEAELLDILGKKGKPLPRAFWSPLFLAAEQALASKAGLLNFFHDHLRAAVRNRYLRKEQQQATAHLRLASYFDRQDAGPRRTDELPWQFARAKSWQRLYDLIADMQFFDAAWDSDRFSIEACWALLCGGPGLTPQNAYATLVKSPSRRASTAFRVALLLKDMGFWAEAATLLRGLVGHYRSTGEIAEKTFRLGELGVVLHGRGRLDEAAKLFREQIRICHRTSDVSGTQAALGRLANILYDKGKLASALKLLAEQQAICKRAGDKYGLQSALGDKALILYDQGFLSASMTLHKREELICRELGDQIELATSLGNQALIIYDRGDLDAAMGLHKAEERIYRDLGCKDGLSVSLGNQAVILSDRGKLDDAIRLHREEEQLCKELGDQHGVAFSLGNQALILAARGRLKEAMKLHKEEERMSRELEDWDGLQGCLGNQGELLQTMGDLDGAMKLHKEEERICRKLKSRLGLCYSLGNQARILRKRGNLVGAIRLHKQEERLCRKLGCKDALQSCLGNQALVWRDRGVPSKAMHLHKQEERLCRKLDLPEGLARSLANQALLMSDRQNRPKDALPLAEEAYRLASEHGYATLAQQVKRILDSIRAKLA